MSTEAFREGYQAYMDWMDYSGERPYNPYDEDHDLFNYREWYRGFEQAGEDS